MCRAIEENFAQIRGKNEQAIKEQAHYRFKNSISAWQTYKQKKKENGVKIGSMDKYDK